MEAHEQGVEPGSNIYTCFPSAQAKQVFFYPCFLGHFHCSGSYHVRRDRYNSFLLLYIHKGTGFADTGQGPYNLRAGDLLLIDCYAPHEYFTRTGWEIYWLHFDGPTARQLYEYVQQKQCLLSTAMPPDIHRRFVRLLNFYEDGEAPDEVLVSQIINDFITDLLISEKSVGSANNEMIDRSIRYISNHFYEKLTLEKIASEVNISSCYFAHIFKNTMGMSVHRYVIHIRLAYACYLLKTSHLCMQEVADSCGFPSAGAFCAAFKKHTGCTPGQYRKETGEQTDTH